MSTQVAGLGKRRRHGSSNEQSLPSAADRAKRHNSSADNGSRREHTTSGSNGSRSEGDRPRSKAVARAELPVQHFDAGGGGGGNSSSRRAPHAAAEAASAQQQHRGLAAATPLGHPSALKERGKQQAERQNAAASPETPQVQIMNSYERSKGKLVQLEEEIRRCMRKYQDSKEQLRQCSEEKETYKAERAELSEELHSTRRQYLNSLKELVAEKQLRTEAERQLARQMAAIHFLEEEQRALAEEHESLAEAHAELQSEQEQKDEDLAQVEDQLAQVQAQLYEETEQRAAELAVAGSMARTLANMQGHHLDSCTVERLEGLSQELELGLRKVGRAIVRRELQANVPESVECKVCMADPFDTALVPCGHMFCNACSTRSDACPVCRTNIRRRLRVYV